MSKTHRKPSALANATSEGLNSFGPVTKDDESTSTVASEAYLGLTAFDSIPDLSIPGQIVAYRAIANSSIIIAVYLAHELVTGEREDEEKFAQIRERLGQRCELYTHAAGQCSMLASTQYDLPMTLEMAYEFARDSAASPQNPDLPDEMLEMLGISRSQLAVIDAEERRKQVARDIEMRASIRENEQGILAEISSLLPAPGGENTTDVDALMQHLPADVHASLFEKVGAKLGAQIQRLLAIRGRYTGALADSMLIAGDVRDWDKARGSFLRQNAGALREI